jgi:hypothetical protein
VDAGKVAAARVAVGSCSVVARRLTHWARLRALPFRDGLAHAPRPIIWRRSLPSMMFATAGIPSRRLLTRSWALDACVEARMRRHARCRGASTRAIEHRLMDAVSLCGILRRSGSRVLRDELN